MRQQPILPVSVAWLVVVFLAAHLPGLALGCGGVINAATPGDLISTDVTCIWTIEAQFGYRVLLYIHSMPGCYNPGLGVKIYDGDSDNDRLIWFFCGQNNQPAIISSSNALYLDLNDQYGEGFSASYTQVDELTLDCDRVLNGSSGQFQSPDADGDGKHEINSICWWLIELDEKSRVKLTILTMDIEPFGCQYDYLKVFDGESDAAPLIGKYCGTIPPPAITSTSNTLYVKFFSDYIFVYRGFTASYISITDGCWSTWSDFGECSRTCDHGTRSRTRLCDSPAPANGGDYCIGHSVEYEACFCQECPEENVPVKDCAEAFSQGEDLCGNNSRCKNTKYGHKCQCCKDYKWNKATGQCEPAPGANEDRPCCGDCQHAECSFIGKVCSSDRKEYDSVAEMVLDRCQKGYGPNKELSIRNYGPCNGPVTPWSEWGPCSVTCGKGLKMKTRNWTKEELSEKKQKQFPLTKTAYCYNEPCPGCPSCNGTCLVNEVCEVVDGTAMCRCCSCNNDESDKVCGSLDGCNIQTYSSLCVLQRTACILGVDFEVISPQPCPVDGEFGPWGDWGACSVTCRGGTQMRFRQCDSPAPAYGGAYCEGDAEQTQQCNTQPCPTECSLVSKNGFYTMELSGIEYTTTEAVNYTACEGDCDNGNECSESGTEEKELLFSCASGPTIPYSVSFPTSCCCS